MGGPGLDPVEATASAPSPDEVLTALRRSPIDRQPSGRWAVTDRATVAAVLTSDTVTVAPAYPPATELDRVHSTMARFSDGEDHTRRRAIAQEALADLEPERLRQRAAQMASAALAMRAEADVTGLAHRIPLRVLAEAMGWHDTALDAAVHTLCARLAPRLDAPDRPSDTTVSARLRDAVGVLDERTINELAIPFQARDATAALVAVAATRLLDGAVREVTVADVLATDRAEPSLHTTTRRTTADLTIDGVTVPAGHTIVVALGAVTQGSADGTMSFGAGVHACPGRDFALALAAGVLTALGRRGAVVARPDTYEARPNLRVPVLRPAKLTAHPETDQE